MTGYDTCYGHRPDLAEERKHNASKGGSTGGRGRPGHGEITRLRKQLKDLAASVVEGKLETSRGAVANQLIGTQVRLLEFERRLRETEELEGRLDAIETTLRGRRKTG
ncbi:MAG: hypothetical protein ACFB50_11885 [Rubrobacteraceae bacterium]